MGLVDPQEFPVVTDDTLDFRVGEATSSLAGMKAYRFVDTLDQSVGHDSGPLGVSEFDAESAMAFPITRGILETVH